MSKPGPPATSAAAREDILRLLEGHRFLSRLPRDELTGLIQQSPLQRFEEREVIFAQGDPGASVMVVVEGFVKLSSSTFGGREVVLEVAGPGAVFGELSVLNGWTRSAEAAALSAGRLLAIEARQFIRSLCQAPEAMFEIIRVLSERLRTATERMTDSVDLPAAARLAKALMRLAALHSHAVKGGLRIDFQLSQRELGAMTGLTRESINKHLAQWRDSGWVSLSDRFVTVHDPRQLQALLSEHEFVPQ